MLDSIIEPLAAVYQLTARKPWRSDVNRVKLIAKERGQHRVSPGGQPGHVDVERRVRGVASNAAVPSTKQGHCTGRVPAEEVGEPDTQLGKSLPQVPLLRRCRFPGTFQDLMRVERHSRVEQTLCLNQRGSGREDKIVRNPRHPIGSVRQRTPERVAGTGVTSTSGGVAVPTLSWHATVLPRAGGHHQTSNVRQQAYLSSGTPVGQLVALGCGVQREPVSDNGVGMNSPLRKQLEQVLHVSKRRDP